MRKGWSGSRHCGVLLSNVPIPAPKSHPRRPNSKHDWLGRHSGGSVYLSFARLRERLLVQPILRRSNSPTPVATLWSPRPFHTRSPQPSCSQGRKSIPGWTDGTDCWHAEVLSSAKPCITPSRSTNSFGDLSKLRNLIGLDKAIAGLGFLRLAHGVARRLGGRWRFVVISRRRVGPADLDHGIYEALRRSPQQRFVTRWLG